MLLCYKYAFIIDNFYAKVSDDTPEKQHFIMTMITISILIRTEKVFETVSVSRNEPPSFK